MFKRSLNRRSIFIYSIYLYILHMTEVLLRKYTVTLKATAKEHKGSKELLMTTFSNFLKAVDGHSNYHQVEKQNSESVHLHALIECPRIKDKRTLCQKQFRGWHIHTAIVPFKDYDNILEIWNKYIHKEQSDASRYELMYGCAFDIPTRLDFNNM